MRLIPDRNRGLRADAGIGLAWKRTAHHGYLYLMFGGRRWKLKWRR